MSLAVWKYSLGDAPTQLIDMPRGARILTLQMQGDEPTIWALVDPDADMERHIISIHGTGHPLEEDELGEYVGTFFLDWYVGHVFDWRTSKAIEAPDTDHVPAV